MISAFHLLWIVPISAFAGYFVAALCAISSRSDSRENKSNLENKDAYTKKS